MAESIRERIEYIAKFLVDHPEQVRVSEVEGENTSVFNGQGDVVDIRPTSQNAAHSVIEEFMLAANREVAHLLLRHRRRRRSGITQSRPTCPACGTP